MGRNFAALFCLLAAMHCVSGLRFASYNIQSGSGMDGKYDLHRTANAIAALHADVVGLQEVDNNTRRHPNDDQTVILSQLTGLPYRHFGKMRNFQGGGYGVAILSRVPFARVEEYHYVKPTAASIGAPLQECNDPVEGDFCQGIVAVLLPGSLWFATTHLGIGLQNQQQAEEARQAVKYINQTLLNKEPHTRVLFSGDFNATPNEEAAQIIARSDLMGDSWIECGAASDPGYTFPSSKPNKRIDYIWFSAEAECVRAYTVDTQASDHVPVVVDFLS